MCGSAIQPDLAHTICVNQVSDGRISRRFRQTRSGFQQGFQTGDDPWPAGHDVVTLGRGSSDRTWSPPAHSDADLKGIDVLVHLASFIPPSHGPEHARQCVEVNALGTLGLLDAART